MKICLTTGDIPILRFTFDTNSGPVSAGEGVIFPDGVTIWREFEGDTYETTVFTGSLTDITARYAGHDGYTFTQLDSKASIASLSVGTGAAAGGTATVLTGVGFTGATAVKFDNTNGTAFSVVNDTTINVTSPAHAAGTVNITVVLPSPDPDAIKYNAWIYTS